MLGKLAAPGWATLEFLWYPLLVFAATPYLLHSLGSEHYGHWMLLTATASFGAFLKVGTGAATIKEVSAGRGQKSDKSVAHAVRTSLGIAIIGGGLLATLIFIVFWFAGDALFEKMGDRAVVRMTGTVAALLAWVEQIDNVFASGLKGTEQFGRSALVEMASRTTQIVAAVLAVMIWQTLAALYIVLIAVAVGRTSLKGWVVSRYLPVPSLRPNFAEMSSNLTYAKWGWLQGIGGLLFGMVDRMLVGSLLGAASLAHYSVALQLAQMIHALPSASMSVLFPLVSRKWERDTEFSLRRLTSRATLGNLLLCSSIAFALIVFGQEILRFWLGEAVATAGADTLRYMAFAYWVLAVSIVPHFVLLGIGRIRFISISALVAGSVGVIVMYIALQSLGLMGAAVGKLAHAVVTLVLAMPLIGYLLDERSRTDH